jgi:hypothetical protein
MKHLLFLLLSLVSLSTLAQDYDSERTTLANFLKRMYNQTKFEGVKLVEDYDSQYLISVLSLDKTRYKTQNAMFRVANVKALRQASEFVNGGTVASDLVIRTVEVKDSTGAVTVSEETVEKIRSAGFVQGMELLINFAPADDDKQMVFIYMRKIE